MTWIWLPVVFGPVAHGEEDSCYHVQFNGPTTVNPITGTVDPSTTPVAYSAIIPENRDSKSAQHGHCFVTHGKALIDEADRARCTNEVAEKDVPIEDRLMVELAQLEGDDAKVEAVFDREKQTATVSTPEGKEMAARLLKQMTFRRLSVEAEQRIKDSLVLVSPQEK